MVYIPGYFFRLINCNETEEPNISLCFMDSPLATPLPGMTEPPALSNAQRTIYDTRLQGFRQEACVP